MSSNLTHARARESAADDWLASRDLVEEATVDAAARVGFITGAEWGEGQAEAREAGRLNDAEILMREAAELLRGYERHHRAKVPPPYEGPGRVISQPACTDEQLAAIEKADRNGLMAARLEGWLRGDRVFPITADGDYVAHAGFRSAKPQAPAGREDPIVGLALSLVQDLGNLVEESGGVYGLHLNGDTARWSDLLRGGANEEWLESFDRLRDALNERFPTNPVDALEHIAEGMVDGVTIRGVDYEAFEQARRQLEEPADFILPAGFDWSQLEGAVVLPSDDKTVEDCKARFGQNVVVGLTFRGPARGKRMDPEVMEGLLAASGQIDGTRPFPLQTPDPRFDPRRPVTVNGFPFTPATEA